ncbi:hypothetical protein MOK15_11970 [Sphingobium sp. BYY-5]|uniref:hypothetical protein n=1 Tax=Sphingobium sp. BYY-5 TaxID=2926400 RepID=UPI001FA7A194|nr:hypothetical protein [Sphingobium sp. BYY-5]MCI4590805.1 hypothetical protein [Sphingobium sp. BYY-5]
MTGGLGERWRRRGGRTVRLVLVFDDIMEFALALLSVPPDELETLGWTFADRKRLHDHFLRSGKAAQRVPRDALGQSLITLRLPRRYLTPLQRFARRELPKAASNAAMLDRVLRVLNEAA